jgi:DNA-binding transcriptional MerR regulator
MKAHHIYSIRHVSAKTGLPKYLIRVWESRYSAVSPLRSNGNRRLFCDNDIERLQLLSKAVDGGHSISQVAVLPHEELMRIVGTDSSETRHQITENKPESPGAGSYYRKSLQLIAELDVNGLQTTLDQAAINLTRPTVILDVIVPLYMEAKRLVQSGNLRLINLNAVTSILQAFLWDLLRNTVVSESAPKIVIGTPTGQRSEIVALAQALIAVESGYRALYFGPNLPANDIAAAVKSNATQAVALFIGDSEVETSAASEVKKLRGKLDDDINILVCTHGNTEISDLAKLAGISVTTLSNFRQKLENLTITDII